MSGSSEETGPGNGLATIEIVGAPVDHGGAGPGAAGGPSALRAAGIVTIEGRTVHDRGDVEVPALPAGTEIVRGPDPESRRPEWPALIAVCRSLHEHTRAIVEAGGIPLVLGGDHTLAAGSMSGVAAAWCARHAASTPEDAPPLGLLWFDAHADLNTPGTTPTGNPHGMPAAALLGHRVAPLDDVVGACGVFDPRRTVFLGCRDLDAGERMRCSSRAAADLPLLIEGDACKRMSPGEIADRVLERLSPDGDAFALSFDLDVLDPGIAPGVNLPTPDGLALDQVMPILER
ncbi:MAG: arginase family protein, partial [Planctomycetota bacterium]|nr:arginase family protein [Planctomycetota bacterium]